MRLIFQLAGGGKWIPKKIEVCGDANLENG